MAVPFPWEKVFAFFATLEPVRKYLGFSDELKIEARARRHWRNYPAKKQTTETCRGVIAVGLGAAAGFGIQTILRQITSVRSLALIDYSRLNWFPLGFAAGVAARLNELPNSFIKRQLGIAPGTAGKGVTGVLFYLLDQVDLLLGVWLVLAFVVEVAWLRVLWSIVLLFFAHQVITIVGYALGMRATAR